MWKAVKSCGKGSEGGVEGEMEALKGRFENPDNMAVHCANRLRLLHVCRAQHSEQMHMEILQKHCPWNKLLMFTPVV